MSSMHRSSKRRRRKPLFQHATQVSTVEERLLQQAIQNSKIDTKRPVDGKLDIPEGPTFYPTHEEFQGNPIDYIESIRPIAQQYGICKIVPPAGWNPPFCVDMESQKKFATKEQLLHRLQEGISFGDGVEYTAAEYQRVASLRAKEWKAKHYPDHDLLKSARDYTAANNTSDADSEKKNDAKIMTPENLEREYWDIVETHTREVSVEYGNDVESNIYGSGFPLSERGRALYGTNSKSNLPEPEFGTPEYYRETWWNLNNIPQAPDSVLRHVKVGINGVNVPWMYYGTLFSTFCWHNEDNYLYSINYHHKGAPKQWYGVPGTKKDSDGVEKVFKSYLSMKLRDIPDLLHHITTMFSPRLLQNAKVPVYRMLQYPGEFVVTFPRSFHAGFSLGPNAGEAVNFATHDWIAHGADANERYRSYARPAVFSHDRLTFTMANHLKEQKHYATCRLLLAELERIVKEELSLRHKLIQDGVRDVSDMITLPRNRLDQLDEASADYDDKRLCFACKHICFFSAVACECSQTKVSCLRHSHYMCRCVTERKYLMIWSDEEEMNGTLEKVRDFCNELKQKEGVGGTEETAAVELPAKAPGVERDAEAHKNEELTLEPVNADPNYFQPATRDSPIAVPVAKRAKTSMAGASLSSYTSGLVEDTLRAYTAQTAKNARTQCADLAAGGPSSGSGKGRDEAATVGNGAIESPSERGVNAAATAGSPSTDGEDLFGDDATETTAATNNGLSNRGIVEGLPAANLSSPIASAVEAPSLVKNSADETLSACSTQATTNKGPSVEVAGLAGVAGSLTPKLEVEGST